MKNRERQRQLLKLRLETEKQFEKLIIYLASGGLLLTITFTEKLNSIENGKHQFWLAYTWLMLAASLTIGLFVNFISVKSIDHILREENIEGYNKNKLVEYLQGLTIVTLLYGVISFVIYATLCLFN